MIQHSFSHSAHHNLIEMQFYLNMLIFLESEICMYKFFVCGDYENVYQIIMLNSKSIFIIFFLNVFILISKAVAW